MSSDIWAIIVAIVALALAGIALGLLIRSRRHRARLAAPLARSIESSRAQLDALSARLASADITQQAYDEQSQALAADLLASSATAPDNDAVVAGTRVRAPVVLACALVAGFAAGAIYLLGGRAPEPSNSAVVSEPGASSAKATAGEGGKSIHALSDEQLQRMVDQATAQVKERPKDAAAWAMLAHSYDMLGKFAESAKAYAQLVRLLPDDAQVLADYADALAVANGRTLKGEPTALVNKALAIDGKNPKALALAGTAAYERKEYAEAIDRWQLARTVATDTALKRQIEDSIADAKAAAKGEVSGGKPAATSPARVAAAGSAAGGGSVVSGRVILADDLIAKAAPDATVFVFARPASGSRMPVALLRRQVRDLPFDFVLDDASAMVRDVKLSQLSTVVIGARISKRGDVMPQAGDMQGWSAPVSVGTRGVKLEISEVLK